MATAAVPASNLLDLVHCELCLEKYNDSNRLPKLLNCSHTFCLACVRRYYESKLKNKLACPNCREIFTVPRGGVQKLKTNIMVVNLLDHLAPFTADDTDEDVAEESILPKDKIPDEPRPILCGLHPREKCDLYCDDCRDPLCADCIVSLSAGPHKTHKIRKLGDVLTTYSTHHKDALQLFTDMSIAVKERTEEMLEELVISRDSLMKEAKSKRDKAHQEADTWYQNTTATISKVYDELHAQILQFMSKSDLQELQQSLEKIDLQKTERDLKQAHSFLDQLQSSVTSFKRSAVWPTKFWSVDVGTITGDFTVDLGRLTESTLKLPDVNNFPFTIQDMYKNTEVAKSDGMKPTRKQRGFRLLSDLPMEPGCNYRVGLTSNVAVVCFDGQSIIKKITFDGNQIIALKQGTLPHNTKGWFMKNYVSVWCAKYILDNNNVLLRLSYEGPSYVLNSQLKLVSTIQEDYGYIIGAESTHRVTFYKDHTIQIYDLEQKQLLQTLTPPAGVKWFGASICRHPDSQGTAVVTWDSNSLCIYDHDGHRLHTHQLQFEPCNEHAIACNRRHLYVVSDHPINVTVYSWSGQLVTKLDTQQLGIPEGQRIYNIAVGEDQFTIAVGPVMLNGNVVSSFKTFQCV